MQPPLSTEKREHKIKRDINMYKETYTTSISGHKHLLNILNTTTTNRASANHLPGVQGRAAASGPASVALLPLHEVLLRELGIDRVDGQKVEARGSHGNDADFGLDVEHALLAARRPDSGACCHFVVLQVVSFGWAVEFGGDGGLGSRVSIMIS
jgi:hypothetical protein